MTNPTPDDALATAKRWMGKLPRDQFDLLLALIADARKGGHVAGFRAGQSHADAGLLAALEAIVAQSRVGDGSKPVTFSGRVNYPAPLLFAARAAIAAWNRRAGQSHDAGLLAALEAVRRQIAQQRGGALYPNDADGFEMALDDIDEAARAAIAAAKGGRDAG